MTVIARLQQLAAREKSVAAPVPDGPPAFVDRAYHVGRGSAFDEAARIVAEAEAAAAERKLRRPGRQRGHGGIGG